MIKLDFLSNNGSGTPLIRIYSEDPKDFALLLADLERLNSNNRGEVELHSLPYIGAINHCKLTICHSTSASSLITQNSALDFTLTIDTDGIETIIDLIIPLKESQTPCYQWLHDTSSTALLISSHEDGSW